MVSPFLTPLVVPSFSSRGFPQERQNLQEVTRNHFVDFAGFFDALLVSAFDLHFGYVRATDIPAGCTVFVDSGGYEAREWEDDSATHLKQLPHAHEDWTPELMARTIAGLPDESRFIYVNLDSDTALAHQVATATAQLSGFRQAKRSFLLKEEPVSHGSAVKCPIADTIAALPSVIAELASFDVIGITEKSLGSSYHERLGNLQLLCALLCKFGLKLPVHVFGALDPLTVRAYVLAGASIFDGLTWIRFAYRDGQCVYLSNDILSESDFDADFTEGRNAVFARNYGQLVQLQDELRHYVQSGDPAQLVLNEPVRAKIQLSLNRGRESELYRRLIG